jgi:hypothetical protein
VVLLQPLDLMEAALAVLLLTTPLLLESQELILLMLVWAVAVGQAEMVALLDHSLQL